MTYLEVSHQHAMAHVMKNHVQGTVMMQSGLLHRLFSCLSLIMRKLTETGKQVFSLWDDCHILGGLP